MYASRELRDHRNKENPDIWLSMAATLSRITFGPGIRYRGLRFIGDYDLKLPHQIFSFDSSVNLPGNNDFLYRLFSMIMTWKWEKLINFFALIKLVAVLSMMSLLGKTLGTGDDLKTSKIDWFFLSYTTIHS